jgi:hypothetical protein
MEQKVKQQRYVFEVLMVFKHNKKVDVGSLIKPRIWIRIRPKRSGSESATLLFTFQINNIPDWFGLVR